MPKLFANNGVPDQTPHSAASDLGLHCLPITLLRVSRLQWVNLKLVCYLVKTVIMGALLCLGNGYTFKGGNFVKTVFAFLLKRDLL